jgi:hypothetical protein
MSTEQQTLTGDALPPVDDLNQLALILWQVGRLYPDAPAEEQLAEAHRRAVEDGLLEDGTEVDE